MDFSINKIAKEYIYNRFPNASVEEKEKYVRDWSNKIKDSFLLVKDFTDRIGDPFGKKILDAGCGNGGVSIAFSLKGADMHGVEIEKDLFEISKEHAKYMNASPKFYLYDGFKLPFENSYFDYAISVSVLEHTTDPIMYLGEIFRVLKPGGCLYLGFPNKFWPKETHTGLWFLTYIPSFLRPLYIKLMKKNPLADNNLHFYSYFNMLSMIKNSNNNWTIIDEKGFSKSLHKILIKKILNFLGISYKVFLPHILVILKK